MNLKKVLATLLCMAITITVLPVQTYAANEETYDIYVAATGSDTEGDGTKAKTYA